MAVREATTLPLLVGSGVTATNLATVLRQADGVIVASALKVDGVWWNPVDPRGRVPSWRSRPVTGERAAGAST